MFGNSYKTIVMEERKLEEKNICLENTTLEEKTTHLKSLIILEMIRILTTRNLEFKKISKNMEIYTATRHIIFSI